MNSKLTATPIVDKNGRPTTVHKRTEKVGSPKTKKVPAPTVSNRKSAGAATRTWLQVPAPLTDSQYKELREWHESLSELPDLPEMDIEIEAEIQELAWHVTREGKASHIVVAKMLDDHVRGIMFQDHDAAIKNLHPDDLNHPVTRVKAYLRVAERIGAEAPEVGSDEKLHHLITRIIEGYNHRPKREDRAMLTSLDTEEGLAALTAITLFFHNAYSNLLHNQTRTDNFMNDAGSLVHGTRMTNRSLDAYLRENPDEVHDIIDYVNTRKPGTTVKDTETILQHVAEIREHGALGKGWL